MAQSAHALVPAAAAAHLEFRADDHVELRCRDGCVQAVPLLMLPLSRLPNDFFPLSCRTCLASTNVPADITVGCMGGQGEQWLLVRNARGAELLSPLGDEVKLGAPGSAGRRTGPVRGFLAIVQRAAAPRAAGPAAHRRRADAARGAAWAGICACAGGVEAVETIVRPQREMPAKVKNMVPGHVWDLVRPYGCNPPRRRSVQPSQARPGSRVRLWR